MINTTWRFVGRVLITIILFTVAFEKLQYPEMYKLDFTKALTNATTFANSLGLVIPDISDNIILLIKFSGLFDALIAALILFGRTSGAALAVLRYVIGLLAYYLPWSAKQLKSYTQRQRFANGIALLGVAIILSRR